MVIPSCSQLCEGYYHRKFCIQVVEQQVARTVSDTPRALGNQRGLVYCSVIMDKKNTMLLDLVMCGWGEGEREVADGTV